MHAPSRRLVWPLSAGLAAACEDPLRPDDVVGTYALRDVAGGALPAIVLTNDYGVWRVLADTLRFTADGRGTNVNVAEHEIPPGASPTGPVRMVSPFTFRTVEGRIEIAFDCREPAASCVAPPHLVARPTTGGLRADYYLMYRVPQTFARITP